MSIFSLFFGLLAGFIAGMIVAAGSWRRALARLGTFAIRTANTPPGGGAAPGAKTQGSNVNRLDIATPAPTSRL